VVYGTPGCAFHQHRRGHWRLVLSLTYHSLQLRTGLIADERAADADACSLESQCDFVDAQVTGHSDGPSQRIVGRASTTIVDANDARNAVALQFMPERSRSNQGLDAFDH